MTILEGKILPAATGREPDPDDPPIFLLQALPTWAPWLPDGQYQRVPIGSAGQVLTVQADGSVNWSNSSAGFTNPMTSTGDLITSNPGSTPVRLAIGTSGQVLTVVGGLPAWAADIGFANPMTTSQDLIVGGASGVAGRLGVGANAQVLTVTSGTVGWANAAAGFTNPMTTLGDVITGASGGAAQRLGIGAANQVLTVSGGVPTWQNSASGFANPMTTAGDMIQGGLMGTATRLPIGANGQILTVVSGAPAWAAGATGASAVVFPTGDTSGVNDRVAIMNANNGLSTGGEILLANGQFYVKPASGNNCLPLSAQTATYQGNTLIAGLPVSMRGLGAATVIYPVGTGVTGIFYHRTTSYGGQYAHPAQPMTGYMRDFTIDGTFAAGASIGLDWGDGWGYGFNLNVVNFNTTGAIGVQQINRLFWTEKNDDLVFRLSNNSTAYYNTTALGPTGDHSSEYNTYYITMFAQANQQGVVIDGVNMGGSHMWIQGNMSISNGSLAAPPNNIACLSIVNAAGVTATDGHRWYEGSFWIKVEGNPGNGTGTTYPYLMFSDGTGYVRNCFGAVWLSQLTPSNWNGAEFGYSGATDDANLIAAANSGYLWAGAPGSTSSGLQIVNTISTNGTVLQVVNKGTSPTSVPIQFIAQGVGDHLFGQFISGETNARYKVDAGGDVQWGPGGASVTDVDLHRTAVGTVTLSDGTNANNKVQLRIAGTVNTNESSAFIQNGVQPATPTGGGVLFVVAGALKYIGSSGTVTTLGNA